MTDSFILEHLKSPPPQSPPLESPDTQPGSSRQKDDALTPISNWAHLSFIKNQRTHLRAELKAHQVAGAEAKQSISSLRRLAFRMAVNISVKEKKIATTARNLASSRKKSYLSARDAEQRIEQLTKILREEEYRNKDILECLEKASMLTLQCKHTPAWSKPRLISLLKTPTPIPKTRTAFSRAHCLRHLLLRRASPTSRTTPSGLRRPRSGRHHHYGRAMAGASRPSTAALSRFVRQTTG